jgi:hypothetical protein
MPNPYALKYSPRLRAKERAKALAIQDTKRAKINTLQRAIVSQFRRNIAPSLNLPIWALFAPGLGLHLRPPETQNDDLRMGLIKGMPQLQIPLISASGAHSCLWLCLVPSSGLITPTQRHVNGLLTQLGHCVAIVRNLEQAQAQIMAYFGS